MPARNSAGTGLCLALAAAIACQSAPSPPPRRPLLEASNLVVVLVDTLRADRLSVLGYGQPTSPFLDGSADKGVRFTNVIAPASQTVPSMVSLWTGLYPARHRNQYFARTRGFRVAERNTVPHADEQLGFLSENLKDAGYRTAAVVTNPWLKPEYGFAQGFEIYEHLDSSTRGPEVNAIAREWFERWRKEKFFVYLHYMDVHIPFREDPKYAGHFQPPAGLDPRFAPLATTYDAEIRAVDDYIASVVTDLEQLGLAAKTLIVVASDHGDEFGEHGGLGHGHNLYQEVVHTPLLLWHPKLAASPRRIDRPVSLVDFAPTILDLLLATQAPQADGRSLLPALEARDLTDDLLFSELGEVIAVRRGDKKLIRDLSAAKGGEEAYDLANDPHEKTPADLQLPWVRELAAAIDEQLEKRLVDDDDRGTIDSATEERVRALGY